MKISNRSKFTFATLGTCTVLAGLWFKEFNSSSIATKTEKENSVDVITPEPPSSVAAFPVPEELPTVAQEQTVSEKIQALTKIPIKPLKQEPELPPLPDSPFLSGESAPAVYNMAPPRGIASEPEEKTEVAKNELNWFLIQLGTTGSQQAQKDTQFDQTTSITNPLVILLAVGKDITETLGFEFSWKQKLSATTPQKSNLPLNSISAGLAWAPFKENYFKLLAGAQLNDMSYLNGTPATPTLKVYTEQNFYAGFQKNFEINDLWFLDVKFLMINSPAKPSDFESYNNSGYVLSLTPEYKPSKDMRIGLTLEYASSQKNSLKLDALGNKESLTIDQQNYGVGLSIRFTF